MADWAGNLVDKIDVYKDEEKVPVLYDAKERPLYRPVGFRPGERSSG